MSSSLEFVRLVNAKQKFKMTTFEFQEFDDVTKEINEDPVPDQVEIWASVKVKYEGEIPESYKSLNLFIGDWVEENEEQLSKVIHEKLQGHFTENYPGSDASALQAVEDTAIWLDQLDYMPRIDETEKTLTIEIEMVLEAEPIEV